MTQQPFSRPGAIDLSGFKRRRGQRPPRGGSRWPGPGGQGRAARRTPSTIDEQNFQATIEASMTAPVLLVFYSRTADARERPARRRPGRPWRASSRAASSSGWSTSTPRPQIAQAMQIPSVPLVVAVIDGRPMPLLQDAVPLDELRQALTQVVQQLTTQGITGRHQPRGAQPEPARTRTGGAGRRPALRRRPGGARGRRRRRGGGGVPEAGRRQPGRRRGRRRPGHGEACCSAPAGSTSRPPASAAAASPDDVDAQTLVADLDLLGGHVDDAFSRLVELVRRTSGKERDAAREHLLGLFGAVGNDDPRVLRGVSAGVGALLTACLAVVSVLLSAGPAPSGRPRAAPPAPGTASTTRSRARPGRRSGSSAGRHRARRRRRP